MLYAVQVCQTAPLSKGIKNFTHCLNTGSLLKRNVRNLLQKILQSYDAGDTPEDEREQTNGHNSVDADILNDSGSCDAVYYNIQS